MGIAVRNVINDGLFEGPRMQAAGKCLSITGGTTDIDFIPEVQADLMGWAVDSPDAARKAARTNLKHGADLIKVMATGGVISSGTESGSTQFNYEEMKAALDEVNKLGLGSLSHAQGTVGIKNAIRAGVRSIDHGFWLDDEAIEMMLERGTFMVPTLTAIYGILEYGVEHGVPKHAVRKAKAAREDHLESFMKAYKAGVNIAMGTDAGTPFNYHGKNAKELELMVDAGMSASDALVVTTLKAAELMGWADRTGSITVGKYADMVALDSSPLDDIKVVADVTHVMKVGELVR